MGNLSLNKELDFIFAQQHLQQLLQQQQPQAPIVRTIKMDPNTTNNLCYSSKFDRSRAFADKMRLEGREAAQAWLAKWPNVGTYPTRHVMCRSCFTVREWHLFASPKVKLVHVAMSAYGTKRTCLVAPHVSAIEGKADMPFCIAHVCF